MRAVAPQRELYVRLEKEIFVTQRGLLCGRYTPQLNTTPQMNYALLPWAKGWYGAVGEQFTRFGTLQLDGNEVANPTGQYLNSSITQIVAGYPIA
jgi:hypothetical protein